MLYVFFICITFHNIKGQYKKHKEKKQYKQSVRVRVTPKFGIQY